MLLLYYNNCCTKPKLLQKNTDLDMNEHELLYNNRLLMGTDPLKALDIVNEAKLLLRGTFVIVCFTNKHCFLVI